MAGLRKVLYAAAALVLLAYLGGLLLPARPAVVETVTIDAWPATVFVLIENRARLPQWLPWLEADPDARTEASGPPRGAGVALGWRGRVSGHGRWTLTATDPYTALDGALELEGRPAARQHFELEGGDGSTELTWRVDFDLRGELFARYAALPANRSLAADMRAGLAGLAELAEGLSHVDFGDLELRHLEVEAQRIAWLTQTSAPDSGSVSEAMGDAYFRILAFIDRHGLTEAGPPMSVSRAFSGGEIRFDAAIPVAGVTGATPEAESGVRIGSTYDGAIVRARHVGPYRTLGATHAKVAAYLAASGIERNGDAWETYVSDPTRTAEENLLTWVDYPVRLAD